MKQNYDIKKHRRRLYSSKLGTFESVDVPRAAFLMADGHGDPNTSLAYAELVTALYSTAYAVRAIAKHRLEQPHTVGPLEGLWSAEDLQVFRRQDKDTWDWTLMIVQPDWITSTIVDEAVERVQEKKGLSAVERVRFEQLDEGKCVQTLHIGPYSEEGPTIGRMHDEFLPGEGMAPRGRHHEIYLSDARRTDPSRLRTILRQPVRPA